MWCQKKKKVKFFSDGIKENMLVRAQEVLIFAKNKYLLAPPGALKVGLREAIIREKKDFL